MRIVFKVFPQKSHYNATFGFAHALRQGGHEVLFAGINELRGHVEAQGFRFFAEELDVFPNMEIRRDIPRFSVWYILKNLRKIRRVSEGERARFCARDTFAKLIAELRPDLLLVDSPYTFHAFALFSHRVPFAILESMMNLNRDSFCPPLDTPFVPGPSPLSRFICALHWRRYFVKRFLLGRLRLRMDFDHRFVRRMATRYGLPDGVVRFDRYFHLGLKTVPEVILSPQELDFPRQLAPNQIYYPGRSGVVRKEAASDYRFSKVFAACSEMRRQGVPLVYCSLGTASWRYDGAMRFLLRVVQAAEGQRWNLIMSVGSDLPFEHFTRVPNNVHLFQSVPQLDVLENCDLMISHGGMNSIAECASRGVRMLICPGTNEIDQAGNAARAVFHDRALAGRLRRETVGSLRRKITKSIEAGRRRSSVKSAPGRSAALTVSAEDVVAHIMSAWPAGTHRRPLRPVAGPALFPEEVAAVQ